MTVPAGYRRVDVPSERRTEGLALLEWGFATHMRSDQVELSATGLDWTRARGVEVAEGPDERHLVAVHSSFASKTRVPGGGLVPTSGLTIVSVHPAHRRRGLLRCMIEDHFARSRSRGEHVSTLIAAETAIYQRFGYGLPSPSLRLTLKRDLALRAVDGADTLHVRLETADIRVHAQAVRAVLSRDLRPGTQAVASDALLADQFGDPESRREGREPLRIAIVEDEQGPAAFALFQRELDWDASGPDGKGTVHGWSAVTPAASRRLWSVLAGLDLMTEMRVDAVALDDPLIHLAEDQRSLGGRLIDQVWLRILDLRGALEARSYAHDFDVVLEVTDDLVPDNAGLWRLRVEGGRARVTAADTGTQVDLHVDIRVLSTIYLGGTTLAALDRAGQVGAAAPGTVDALSRAFAGDMAPHSTFYF